MNAQQLFMRSRPLYWIVPVGIYATGMLLGGYTWISFVQLLFFTWPINYVIYAINDYYDEETDKNNPRKISSWMHGTPITQEEKRYVPALTSIIVVLFLLLAVFVGTTHFLLALLAVVIGWAYNTKPVHLKGTVLGCVASTTGYTLIFVLAYTVTNSLTAIPWYTYTIMLPAIGMHIVSEFADKEADKKAQYKTVGATLTRRQAFSILAASILVPLVAYWPDAFWTATLLLALLLALIQVALRTEKYVMLTLKTYFLLLVGVLAYKVVEAIL